MMALLKKIRTTLTLAFVAAALGVAFGSATASARQMDECPNERCNAATWNSCRSMVNRECEADFPCDYWLCDEG